jgi:hypothetical protein
MCIRVRPLADRIKAGSSDSGQYIPSLAAYSNYSYSAHVLVMSTAAQDYDADPIWSSSRTARQIHDLGRVEKVTSSLLSLPSAMT